MQLLIVAYADSLHTARGIAMLDETGWDIHLFDSNLVTSVHPALHDVTLHPASPVDVSPASGVRVAPAQTGPRGSFSARVEHLARVLDEESFDAVHGEGLLDGCALVDAVRRDHGLGPPWVASN